MISLRVSVTVNIVLALYLVVSNLPHLAMVPLRAPDDSGSACDEDATFLSIIDSGTTLPPSQGLSPLPVLGTARTVADGSLLGYSHPLWQLLPHHHTFRLWVPPDVTRICVDVGAFLTSPSAAKWWARDTRTFVVAFEPNFISAALMSRFSHPAFVSQLVGYWPHCNFKGRVEEQMYMAQCLQNNWAHITEHFDRFLLIPVALSNVSGFARLYAGLPNRSDTSSLLNFRGEFIRHLRQKSSTPTAAAKLLSGTAVHFPVAVETLRTVLELLPQNVLWDTLKIDAQGVDRLVVAGAGDLVANFACVIGEFSERKYAVPKGKKYDYKSHLFRLGFVGVKHGVFVNTKFEKQLLDGAVLCSATDVTVTKSEIELSFSRQRLLKK